MRYSEVVTEHFDHPRRCGRLPADSARVVTGTAGRVETGARVAIDLAFDEGNDSHAAVVADVRWRVYGCPHLVAATSLLADRLPGTPMARLRELRPVSMAEELDLPPAKLGLMLVLEDALRAAADAAEALISE
ncbi:MAG: iron-sulfur cluster assembly scaffold protein [Pseudomonadota bacterium]